MNQFEGVVEDIILSIHSALQRTCPQPIPSSSLQTLATISTKTYLIP